MTDLDAGRSTLSVGVIADGDYFIQISAKGFEGNVGSYTVETSRVDLDEYQADDIPEAGNTGFTVSPGVPLSSQINNPGDVDWVRASLEKDKVYKIDVLGLGDGAGTLPDSTLRLLGPDGAQVAFDKDSGAGRDAEVYYTPTQTGDYFFEVSGSGDASGSYTLRLRELYNGFEDPLSGQQSYLEELGLAKLNGEYSGAGITVGVIDDGVEYAHPDLVNQIDFQGSMDAQYQTEDGRHKHPDIVPLSPDSHGTPVAGIIAAEEGNMTGVVGIAHDAEIASTRVKWALPHMTGALQEQVNFEVSNNSWGATDIFSDDFNSADWMMAYQGLKYAVENGRDGDGTIFVFSAGNSRAAADNVNYHNFQNARETITVAATEIDGTVASFSTPGAAILVGAYGVDLLTTDRLGGLGINKSGDYVAFTGTSAAAPVVSGVISLMLEANPDLGYRDVQEILAYSAWHPDDNTTWTKNGGSGANLTGLRFNDDLGFGVVDAHAAVRLAEVWDNTENAHNEVRDGDRIIGGDAYRLIADDGSDEVFTFFIDSHIETEHAVLSVDIAHSRLGDLEVDLVSPDGTVSRLIDRPTVTDNRPLGLSGEFSDTPGRIIFDLSSVQYMSEDAYGTWKAIVRDVAAEETGLVRSMSLNVYGSPPDEDDNYIFTDEFSSAGIVAELTDDSGVDTINAAAVTQTVFADLDGGIVILGGEKVDGLWEGGESFTIADWTDIENVYGGDGDDELVGNSLNNILRGGRGDDLFLCGLGSDTVYGGDGTDAVLYQSQSEDLIQNVSYDYEAKCVSVGGGSLDNAWIDTLYGIEQLIFNDLIVTIDELFSVNEAPTINSLVLNQPLTVGSGQSLDFDIPENAFVDANEESRDLSISVVLLDGQGEKVELPEWLSFDPETGKISGTPDTDDVGRYRLLLRAEDDHGEAAEREISLEVGDNRAPILDAPSIIHLEEDAENSLLGITLPVDPEGDSISIEVIEVPSRGEVLHGLSGLALQIGDIITPGQLADLAFAPEENFAGNAGSFVYAAEDARGVSSSSSVAFEVAAVNDAPSFGVSTAVTLEYNGEALSVDLSIPVPTDAETPINFTTITEMPSFGSLTMGDGTELTVGDTVSVEDLSFLRFQFDSSVNGPIGAVALSATDLQGEEANWKVDIAVNGDITEVLGSHSSDQLFGSVVNDQIFGLSGDDVILANAGDDRVYAGSGDDQIVGGAGIDTIDGGAGDDIIDGGAGADKMYGGIGDDTYYVDNPGDRTVEVVSQSSGGFDTVISSVNASLGLHIEALKSAGIDLTLQGNSVDNVITGNDTNEELYGLGGNDLLAGGGGDDLLDGGAGRDRMIGGGGDDNYFIDSRSDVVIESAGEGHDIVFSSTSYSLSANVEELRLTGNEDAFAGGNSLDNILLGNDGNNILSGGLGADRMEGGSGNDIYVVDRIEDIVIDSAGIDTIRASIDISVLNDDIENVELIGFFNVDATGNDKDNELSGNSASNTLNGGLGSDTLSGGAGSDIFILDNVGSGTDTITDFNVEDDLLMLDAVGLGLFEPSSEKGLWILDNLLSSENGLTAENFVSGDGAVAVDGDDFVIYDTAQKALFIDGDANGSQEAMKVAIFANEEEVVLSHQNLLLAI